MNLGAAKILTRIISALSLLAVVGGAVPAFAISTHPQSGDDMRLSFYPSAPLIPVFTTLELHPNIETMGVVVSGSDLPKSAQLMYRRSDETAWQGGHPLTRIDGGRLVGSLFGLIPSTTYEIKVFEGGTEILGSMTTQRDEIQFNPATVIYVDDDAAAGGDGSAAAPLRTIQEGVNRAVAGTQVLVADGTYNETVSFPASGAEGNWIQVKAQGNGAILDGSDHLGGDIWKPLEGTRNIWYTKISSPIAYLARDQKRFYMYDDYSGLLEGRGHNKVSMNEGWYIAPYTTKLYVRSMDNPSNHVWQVPLRDHAFYAEGRDWLWVEGFEMQFYGIRDGCGVCMKNSSHVVVRRNRIHNLQKGVFIEWTGGESRGNDTRIEFNQIYDPGVYDWPWDAVKGTSMEGTAIVLRGHIGAIVRGNDIHDFFNGIYTGSSAALEDPGIAFDADIYENQIHQILDDGLEPEGACINQRFRNNNVNSAYIGISLAPITQGPTWVIRNLFVNFTGRGVKWDRNSDGTVLIYHNTGWTDSENVNGMDFISPAWNAVMRNNIFRVGGYGIAEVPRGSGGHDWNFDNWYSTRGAGGSVYKWEGVNYNSLVELCSATGLECDGLESPPGLRNPDGGDFSLLPSSPNIDRGVLVPGINDNFLGSRPDIGAFEFGFDPVPVVASITRLDLDPTDAQIVNFLVTFSEPVTGVDQAPPFYDFQLAFDPGITGADIKDVVPISASVVQVSVNTGIGNGSLRLDLLDDDSIRDLAGNPLGGSGGGNGNFTSGDSYTIEKKLPIVTSILLSDPTPIDADIVRFTVNFNEDVSGVDFGDFSLDTIGNLTGAAVAEVTGAQSRYTVAVLTGSGEGSLRLVLQDDDSIYNASNIPLGGAGAGNGDYLAGETYAIDRSAPFVLGISRVDLDPVITDTVNYSVAFSEEISGVDIGDFSLASSGGISGANLISVYATGVANTYLVTVGTGSGDGNLRLDLIDDDSIFDPAGHPLGGPGAGNGGFTTGEVYTIQKSNIKRISEAFRSNGANDGWVLESEENSNLGGSRNSLSTTFNLGDDERDRQYRAILHFPTQSLPDDAVITMAILLIQVQGLRGTDPFGTHQNITIDIRDGYFGSSGWFGINGLDISDFETPAARSSVGLIYNNPVNGWYWSLLDSSAFPFINRRGVTQVRLAFEIDDNDDQVADYLRFYSGNHGRQANRPQLKVEYYIPK